jgi:ribonuclease PH
MPSSSSQILRRKGRRPDQMRPVKFEADVAKNAISSVLCSFGNTQVICAVSIENAVPRWMKEQNVTGGWITAEYSMLPYSTSIRKPRDSTRGKVDGRSTEIQRLIGRSLRAVCDLTALGERTLWVDCDVLRADGGTRTAAITGAVTALEIARLRLEKEEKKPCSFLRYLASAVSVGIVDGQALLDLDYVEDSRAEADMNVVMTDSGNYVEVQVSGEESTFNPAQLKKMLKLAQKGCSEISEVRKNFLKKFSHRSVRKTKIF